MRLSKTKLTGLAQKGKMGKSLQHTTKHGRRQVTMLFGTCDRDVLVTCRTIYHLPHRLKLKTLSLFSYSL